MEDLPFEMFEEISAHLSDADIINLAQAIKIPGLRLRDSHTLSDIRRWGSKFRYTHMIVWPYQEIPPEYRHLPYTVDWGNFLTTLFHIMATKFHVLEVDGVPVQHRPYKKYVRMIEDDMDDEGIFDEWCIRPVNPPSSAEYVWNFDTFEFNPLSTYVEYGRVVPYFGSLTEYVVDLIRDPDFQTSEVWSIRNPHEWVHLCKKCNSDYGIPNYHLPYWAETHIFHPNSEITTEHLPIDLPVGSTIEDIYTTYLNLKSHKFDNETERFNGIRELVVTPERISFDLHFDI